jgi:hypothetical protein
MGIDGLKPSTFLTQQRVLTWSTFVTQEILVARTKHFQMSQLGKCYWSLEGRDKDADKHLIMYRTTSYKELHGPRCNVQGGQMYQTVVLMRVEIMTYIFFWRSILVFQSSN